VKMHIQGGEFLALEGAKRLFDDGRIAGVIVGFAPHALSTTEAPENLLRYVPQDWLIYHLGRDQWTIREPATALSRDGFGEFAGGLADANVENTFLLLHRPGLDLRALLDFTQDASPPPPSTELLSPPPSAELLAELVNGGKHADAAELVSELDPDAIDDADLLYYAGVALGSASDKGKAIRLLKRALECGYAPFWCAYHLGLFEAAAGNAANAVFYYVASLLLDPGRTDLFALLEHVAPNFDRGALTAAQGGRRAPKAAQAAVRAGEAELAAGRTGPAAFYFTIAGIRDPEQAEARRRLGEMAPDISLGVLWGG